MTLTEFTRDVVPIIYTTFTGLGLISLVLLWKQLKQVHAWNKLKACQDYFNNTKLSEREDLMYRLFKDYGLVISRHSPVDESRIEIILRNDRYDLFSAIISYIDEQEWFCTALLRGVLDEDYAFGAVSTQTIGAYDTLEKFIVHRRKQLSSELLYKDFQTVVRNWKERTKALHDQLDQQTSTKQFRA